MYILGKAIKNLNHRTVFVCTLIPRFFCDNLRKVLPVLRLHICFLCTKVLLRILIFTYIGKQWFYLILFLRNSILCSVTVVFSNQAEVGLLVSFNNVRGSWFMACVPIPLLPIKKFHGDPIGYSRVITPCTHLRTEARKGDILKLE